jgi:hypothetical protein
MGQAFEGVCVRARYCRSGRIKAIRYICIGGGDQEEAVDEGVEVEGAVEVAGVLRDVEGDLDGGDDPRVEEEARRDGDADCRGRAHMCEGVWCRVWCVVCACVCACVIESNKVYGRRPAVSGMRTA